MPGGKDPGGKDPGGKDPGAPGKDPGGKDPGWQDPGGQVGAFVIVGARADAIVDGWRRPCGAGGAVGERVVAGA
jgi:hypothetical protein